MYSLAILNVFFGYSECIPLAILNTCTLLAILNAFFGYSECILLAILNVFFGYFEYLHLF